MSNHTQAPLLAGALSGFALADVLQLLELGARSGLLVVDGGPFGGGSVRLHDGRVVAVSTGRPGTTSDDHAAAVAALLELPAGHWAFHATNDRSCGARAASAPAEEGTRVSAILVDAARRRDERTRAGRAAAPEVDVPALASFDDQTPDHSGGRRLTAVDLQVLAAVDGVRDVAAIAAAVRRDPARVRDALRALRAVGVVRARDQRIATGAAA